MTVFTPEDHHCFPEMLLGSLFYNDNNNNEQNVWCLLCARHCWALRVLICIILTTTLKYLTIIFILRAKEMKHRGVKKCAKASYLVSRVRRI